MHSPVGCRIADTEPHVADLLKTIEQQQRNRHRAERRLRRQLGRSSIAATPKAKEKFHMHTVILCRALHPSGMALLEARPDVTIRTLNRPSRAEFAAAMPGVHAVLVALEDVDEALLSRSPDL